MTDQEIEAWLCDIRSSRDASNAIRLWHELKATRKVVEASRPFVRALELVQGCLPDHEIEDAWSKELVLQKSLKQLDGL